VRGRALLSPREYGPAAQLAVLDRKDEAGNDVLPYADPAAFRASAERIVERKQPRLDFGNGEAGNRAGEFLRKDEAARIGGSCRREFGFIFAYLSAVLRAATIPLKGGDRIIRQFRDRQTVSKFQCLL